MTASLLARDRIVYTEHAFADLVVWRVPKPAEGSMHLCKYRVALVVNGTRVLRYDNEPGKGDRRHRRGREAPFPFSSLDRPIAEFERDVKELLDEDRRT